MRRGLRSTHAKVNEALLQRQLFLAMGALTIVIAICALYSKTYQPGPRKERDPNAIEAESLRVDNEKLKLEVSQLKRKISKLRAEQQRVPAQQEERSPQQSQYP